MIDPILYQSVDKPSVRSDGLAYSNPLLGLDFVIIVVIFTHRVSSVAATKPYNRQPRVLQEIMYLSEPNENANLVPALMHPFHRSHNMS